MKSIVLFSTLLIGFCLVQSTVAQEEMQDVVYLKDGSIVRGTIIEQAPNASIKILTRDGNTFVYNMGDVERIAKERRMGVYRGPKKSPGGALALSLVFGGLFPIQGTGQWYNGEIAEGFLYLLVGLASAGAVVDGLEKGDADEAGLGALVYLVSWIWGSVDAYKSANRLNRERGYYSFSDQSPKLLLTLQGTNKSNVSVGIRTNLSLH